METLAGDVPYRRQKEEDLGMKDMEHHIVNKQNITIASFVLKSDRDLCLDALERNHPDCIFSKADDE